MKSISHISVAVGVALLLAGAAGGETSKSDAVKGRKRYVEVGCAQCHGTEGQGGGRRGPKLAPDVFPMEALLFQLRHPRDLMPAYSEHILSDMEVRDIHAYLSTIRAGKPAAQIKLLQLD